VISITQFTPGQQTPALASETPTDCTCSRRTAETRRDPRGQNSRHHTGRLPRDRPSPYWEGTLSHLGTDLHVPVIQGSRWETARRDRLPRAVSEDRGDLCREKRKSPEGIGHACLGGFFFINWEQLPVQCQMLIFSITQIIFPVLKISSTLIFCSTLFIILSKLISYYALRMEKKPHISTRHIGLYCFAPLQLHREFILSSGDYT